MRTRRFRGGGHLHAMVEDERAEIESRWGHDDVIYGWVPASPPGDIGKRVGIAREPLQGGETFSMVRGERLWEGLSEGGEAFLIQSTTSFGRGRDLGLSAHLPRSGPRRLRWRRTTTPSYNILFRPRDGLLVSEVLVG